MESEREHMEDIKSKYGFFMSYLYPMCQQHVDTLKSHFTDEAVIFDVGSNIGLFSKAICSRANYKELYLFEPVQEYHTVSKSLLCDYPNINFVNKGLSDKDDRLIIYKSGNLHNAGWNTFMEEDPMQPQGKIQKQYMNGETCELTTLTKFCEENQIRNIDFIKIDVEGFEYKVIEGALPFLEKCQKKPYLFVEVGWGTNHPHWTEAKKVYDKLFSIGYKRVEFTEATQDILFEPIITQISPNVTTGIVGKNEGLKLIIGSEGCGYLFKDIVEYVIKVARQDKGEGQSTEFEWMTHNSDKQPDLIVRSFMFGGEREMQQKAPYICWSGEAYAIPCREYSPICNLNSFYARDEKDRFYPLAMYITSKHLLNANDDLRKHKEVEKTCDVIACFSNPVAERVRFFNLLCTNSNMNVKGLGKCCNTEGHVLAGDFHDVVPTYATAKFVLAMENCVKEGYLTEKIINAYLANAIPIYWGDSKTAKRFFNDRSFICINDYPSFENCVEEISKIAKDELRWKQMLAEPVFASEEAKQYLTLNLHNPHPYHIETGKTILAEIEGSAPKVGQRS